MARHVRSPLVAQERDGPVLDGAPAGRRRAIYQEAATAAWEECREIETQVAVLEAHVGSLRDRAAALRSLVTALGELVPEHRPRRLVRGPRHAADGTSEPTA